MSNSVLVDFSVESDLWNGIKSENSEQEDNLLEASRNLVTKFFGDESHRVDASRLSIIDKVLLKSLKAANQQLQRAIRNDRDCRFNLRSAEKSLVAASAEVEAIMSHFKKLTYEPLALDEDILSKVCYPRIE